MQEESYTGYLYPKEEGIWILSSEPNLKSCCIGAEKKRDEQLIVFGDFSKIAPQKAVTFKGVVETLPNQQRVLKDAVNVTPSSFPLFTLGLAALGFLFIFRYFRKST